MRTWTAENPKAALMERKRDALLAAALAAFLEEGYAGSSVNRIAAAAGVSIKTLYRHFDSKEDLFSAVIERSCEVSAALRDPAWTDLPPRQGLAEVGAEHLAFLLSADHLALLRLVTREAPRFPDLGRAYREQIVDSRTAEFVRYLEHWPDELRARVRTPMRAARSFFALLAEEMVQAALQVGEVPTPSDLEKHAQEAAADLIALIEADRL